MSIDPVDAATLVLSSYLLWDGTLGQTVATAEPREIAEAMLRSAEAHLAYQETKDPEVVVVRKTRGGSQRTTHVQLTGPALNYVEIDVAGDVTGVRVEFYPPLVPRRRLPLEYRVWMPA